MNVSESLFILIFVIHKKKIIKIKSVLQDSKNIVITVHKSPDGDFLGSALFLYDVLSQLNHNVRVVSLILMASFFILDEGNGDVLVFSEDMMSQQ